MFSLAGRLELGFIEPSEVLAILCDYSNKAADIWSNVDQSSSERVGNTLGVELYDVQQTCSWRFTLFSGQFDCRIRVEQRQENEGSSGLNPQLQFKLIKSSFMKDFEGSWKVSKEGNGVVVEHLLSVRPMIEIPQSLSSLSQGIFCAQVQATLTDLENEVERLRNRNNN